MEYLSLPHTRAATTHLVPEINDTLLTNLRNPLMTLVEDTSPGAHDTLTAACDANMYAALGIEKPEEHGSCAENLVLALKEINEKAGLKGTRAVGADITVNIAPTPLHLFMNAPLQLDSTSHGDGAGAKGTTFSVEEPKCKKRSYVKFRAERDIVIVMSACPNEVGPQNGGKCMAANFTVEEPDGPPASKSTAETTRSSPNKKSKTLQKNSNEKEQDAEGKPNSGDATAAEQVEPKQAGDQDEGVSQSHTSKEVETVRQDTKADQRASAEVSKPKRKPKKLERRNATPKSEM